MEQLTAGTREWAGTFAGTPRQLAYARHTVAGILAGCPRADDAVLIVSELATNAVLHGGSRGQSGNRGVGGNQTGHVVWCRLELHAPLNWLAGDR